MITREAARILHQEGNFLRNVNRSYADEFAQRGAKAGYSVNLRLPVKYNTRSGASLSTQDHVERSTPFSVSTQYGVDVSFSTADRTMALDDFSQRVLKPAMRQLAAKIESDCLASAYKLVSNYTNATTNAVMDYKKFQQNGRYITDQLGPLSDRAAILNPGSAIEFRDAVKGLFQSSTNIKDQYVEGEIGRTGGFEVYENTLLPPHTTGSLAGSPLTAGAALGVSTTANSWASQTQLSIDGATSSTTVKAGDIITISGVYAVHPESKANLGYLQRFVVQADVTLTTSANAYAVTVKPAMIYGAGNAYQNCVLSGPSDSDNNTITRAGAASTVFAQDLFFHKDAFVFATADLEDVSPYGAQCSRAVSDSISLRWIQQYVSSSDNVVGRFDVLWGFGGLYPELACRHLTTQSLIV